MILRLNTNWIIILLFAIACVTGYCYCFWFVIVFVIGAATAAAVTTDDVFNIVIVVVIIVIITIITTTTTMIIISYFILHIISLSTEYLQSFLHKEIHITLIVSVKRNLNNFITAQSLCG